jgi:hypothetical protein
MEFFRLVLSWHALCTISIERNESLNIDSNPFTFIQENFMNTLIIKDLAVTNELDHEAMASTQGGMKKLPFQRASTSDLLTSPDGEPVSVYVDGVLTNSVTDGYAHH